MIDTSLPSSSSSGNSSVVTTATSNSERPGTDDSYSCSSSSENSSPLTIATTKAARRDFDNTPASARTFSSPAKRAKKRDLQMMNSASTLPDKPTPTTSTEKKYVTRSRKFKLDDINNETNSSCLDDSYAIFQIGTWTWELATSKPPQASAPDVGPMNEVKSFCEKESIGYQGLPTELAQQIRDLQNKHVGVDRADAMYFERSYRKAKELELAGAGDPDFTPEQCFQGAINGHMFSLERGRKEAEKKRRKAKKQAKESKWPEWKGKKKDKPTWPNWGKTQMAVADRPLAELVGRVDSFGPMDSPTLEPKDAATVTVTELDDSASCSSCPPPPCLSGLGRPISVHASTGSVDSLDLTSPPPLEPEEIAEIVRELTDSTPNSSCPTTPHSFGFDQPVPILSPVELLKKFDSLELTSSQNLATEPLKKVVPLTLPPRRMTLKIPRIPPLQYP